MRSTIRNLYHLAIKLLWIGLRPLIKFRLKGGVKVALTCSRDDGGGAQIHGRISTLAFAREFGFDYVETPIKKLNVDGSKSDIEKWNQVLMFDRLATGKVSEFKLVKIDSLSSLVVAVLFRASSLNMVCFQVRHCHSYTDRFLESIACLREELRENMGSTLKLDNIANYDSVLHVRGRFGGIEVASPRLTSIQTIRDKVGFACRVASNDRVVIFTPGFDPELQVFESNSVRVDFSSDVFFTLNTMIRAAHFFMAKSSLSYVAALLCEGTVYYENFWHPKIKNWQTIKP